MLALALFAGLSACGERRAEGVAERAEGVAEKAEGVGDTAEGGETKGSVRREGQAEHSRAAQRPTGPSLIVINIDTLRRDHLSLHGYERPTSPRLEELARESIVFEHAVSTSPWTKPSTVSLFSGLHPSEHGAGGERKPRTNVRFIAEVLAEHGYQTAGFSGNPYVSATYGLDRGFAHFDFQGGREARDYDDIRVLIDRARFWLDTREAGPFFLYLHVMNVHGPYRAPAEYRERFLEEPYQEFPFQNPLWMDIVTRSKVERRQDVKPEHLRDLRARYDGAIAYTDAVLGQFIDDLRTRGLLDESVLLITADHGEELFDHGSFGHRRSLHGELLDIPLLIRLPGGRAGGLRVDLPISLIDVPPTLLELAGLLDQMPDRRFGRGRSLTPLFDGERAARPERALLAELIHRDGTNTMLEQWPYRMIDMLDAPAPQLYRVDVDAGETRNLAAAQPDVVTRLAELATQMQPDAGSFAPGEQVPIDDALRQQLEALGYIDQAP